MKAKIFRIIRNKYAIALAGFLVWLSFFDNNNLIFQYRLKSGLHDLNREKEFFLSEIEKDSKTLKQLTEDREALEKYAREKYLMKKENEDIFLIIGDEEEDGSKK